MNIKAEILKVRNLEQVYIRHCNVTINSLKSSRAFHDWHKAMLILFNKAIPEGNENFQYIKSKEAIGNGYNLKSLYDDISCRYEMLMDDLDNGKYGINTQTTDPCNIWALIHPSIAEVSKKRIKDEYFADAVEAACKTLNARVRAIVLDQTGEELDGAGLMRKAFSPRNPIISIAPSFSKSGNDIQQGYMDIFAGVMTGIRNPKAHDNETITKEDALRKLVMISILMFKIDERVISK